MHAGNPGYCNDNCAHGRIAAPPGGRSPSDPGRLAPQNVCPGFGLFEFTQERHLKLFAEPLKSEGVMLIQRPDQIRWETTLPFQSILMGNHESVAQFEKEDGQWKKLKLGFPQMLRRVIEQMSLMHQGKMEALTADFNVSVATGAVAVVTLKPKDNLSAQCCHRWKFTCCRIFRRRAKWS